MSPRTIVRDAAGRASADALRVCAALADAPEESKRLHPDEITQLLADALGRLQGAAATWEQMLWGDCD
jgi:hypothetical protein